jgi:hypothetical protein
VKVHHITALGVDLIVLPPDLDRVQLSDGLLFGTPAVGDIVDGDIECPNLLYHQGLYGCGRCWGSGTVSVPHVVRDVRRILAWDNTEDANGQDAQGYLRVGESHVWFHWPTRIPTDGWLVESVDRAVLPDAEPGGVALLVEPFRETP